MVHNTLSIWQMVKTFSHLHFHFPHKILQKFVPTYIFISHTKVSFLTQNFSLALTRPLTFTHTHTPPRRRRRAEPSPAQRRRRRRRAQPLTPLLLDLSTVNPYPSALSPSPQDPFSLSPSLTLPPPYPFIFPHHTHTHTHSDFADVGNLDHCAKYLNQKLVTYGFPASLDLFANDPVSFCLDSFGFFALIQSKLMFVYLGFDREDLQLYVLVALAEAARCWIQRLC